MTVQITLNDVENLQNWTTAALTIDNNSSAIETAFGTALSTGGDQMEGNIDMNSKRIINLPAPITGDEPLRFQDAVTLNGGGTIAVFPPGGTTGQVLGKNSNANYDVSWESPVTGTVTTIGGNSGAFTLTNGITNVANDIVLSFIPNNTYLGNTSGVSNFPVSTAFRAPTRTVLTSGTGTYTTPANVLYLEVTLVGGGSGGGGGNPSGNVSVAGGNTTFSTFTANGGGTAGIVAGQGGTASGGTYNITGGSGTGGSTSVSSVIVGSGGTGGNSSLGGAGGGQAGFANGFNASTNSGSGGGGGGVNSIATSGAGAGGGAGGTCFGAITSPSSSYSYSVGTGGAGGATAGNGGVGGIGGSGIIIVKECYQ